MKKKFCFPRALFFILALGFIPHGLFSGEDAPQAKTFQYNAELTVQLKAIIDARKVYGQHSETTQRLVCAKADPNVSDSYSMPLLHIAVLLDDVKAARCYLEHGAKANRSGHLSDIDSAKSVAMLQCFEACGFDLHQKNNGETLLHNAATQIRSPEVITFLCDAGLNPSEGDSSLYTPLHRLFCSGSFLFSDMLQKVALLSWYGADHHNPKNIHRESPFEAASRTCPKLVPQVQALGTIVPLVKTQHKKEYNNMLATHITAGPASLVMTYVEPSWGERCWLQISDGIAQQIGLLTEPAQESALHKSPGKKQKS